MQIVPFCSTISPRLSSSLGAPTTNTFFCFFPYRGPLLFSHLYLRYADVLVEYLNAAPEARDYRRKDGALVAIAVLAKVRKRTRVCLRVCV